MTGRNLGKFARLSKPLNLVEQNLKLILIVQATEIKEIITSEIKQLIHEELKAEHFQKMRVFIQMELKELKHTFMSYSGRTMYSGKNHIDEIEDRLQASIGKEVEKQKRHKNMEENTRKILNKDRNNL